MIWSILMAVAYAQELPATVPHVQTATDMWGVGGGGLAGLVSAVLALTVKDKLLSRDRGPAAAADSSTLQDFQTRVTRLELHMEALRDTQRDLRQLTETLGQLIRDLASSK